MDTIVRKIWGNDKPNIPLRETMPAMGNSIRKPLSNMGFNTNMPPMRIDTYSK
jgi:hypothetical protein